MYGIRWKWDGPYAYVVSWYALYTQCTLTGWSHDQDQKTIDGGILQIEIIIIMLIWTCCLAEILLQL